MDFWLKVIASWRSSWIFKRQWIGKRNCIVCKNCCFTPSAIERIAHAMIHTFPHQQSIIHASLHQQSKIWNMQDLAFSSSISNRNSSTCKNSYFLPWANERVAYARISASSSSTLVMDKKESIRSGTYCDPAKDWQQIYLWVLWCSARPAENKTQRIKLIRQSEIFEIFVHHKTRKLRYKDNERASYDTLRSR